MLRNVVILFLVVYPLYVLFTREPDYFDGEYSRATIHFIKDSSGLQKAMAIYSFDHHTYSIHTEYSFRSFSEGEGVTIIYETAAPAHASLYSVWGYWVRWQELVSFVLMFVFFYVLAVNITCNPTLESLLEELEGNQPKPRKPRYD